MRIHPHILSIITLLAFHHGFSQNLKEATKEYVNRDPLSSFLNFNSNLEDAIFCRSADSYTFYLDCNKEFITAHKIKSISKYRDDFYQRKDTLEFKYIFNELGNPLEKINTTYGRDSSIAHYTYNANNEVIKKTITKKCEYAPFAYKLSNVCEWKYDENDFLVSRDEYDVLYSLSDTIPGAIVSRIEYKNRQKYTYDLVESSVLTKRFTAGSVSEKDRNDAYEITFHPNGKRSEVYYNNEADTIGTKHDIYGYWSPKHDNLDSLLIYPKFCRPVYKDKISSIDTTKFFKEGGKMIKYTSHNDTEKGIQTILLTFDSLGKIVKKEIYLHKEKSDFLLMSLIVEFKDEQAITNTFFLSSTSSRNLSYYIGENSRSADDIYVNVHYEYDENGLIKNVLYYDSYGDRQNLSRKEWYVYEYRE